jgi:hypothetical protein
MKKVQPILDRIKNAWSKFNWADKVFYIVFVAQFFFGFIPKVVLASKKNMSDLTLQAVAYNFGLPIMILMIAFGTQSKSKRVKLLSLIVGGLWFAYLIAYYCFGFHNPWWGN